MKRFISMAVLAVFFGVSGEAFSEQKVWSASGDGTNWTDKNNWSSVGVPTETDDVRVTLPNASINITSNFIAQSLILGGSGAATVTSDNFVYGTIGPPVGTNIAVLNQSGGLLEMKGAGTVVLKGQHKFTKGTVTAQPSFMALLE